MDCFVDAADGAVPVLPVTREGLGRWLETAPAARARWVRQHDFESSAARHIEVPGEDGSIGEVLAAATDPPGVFTLGDLPRSLPPGTVCALAGTRGAAEATALATGWALGSYRFDRYRPDAKAAPRLVRPPAARMDRVAAVAESVHLGRDLVNTPAEDMGPAELADAAADVAAAHGARLRVVEGEDLLRENYPAIHAVGRASARAPRLIDLVWGEPGAPGIALVGKGVCFDSGGLNLKPASGMELMKKDMGGAAAALALASMIMRLRLPVRLRLLIPAVENAVSGNAFRPLDVIATRADLAIEIGDTDAEGRVILADALAEAASWKPDLLIDMATLTGAARVALGTELPAFFSNDDGLAREIEESGRRAEDEVWRLPLWPGYRKAMESDVADLSTTGSLKGAGAIAAALFLERFVGEGVPWAHFDLMAWNLVARPGRPRGGEVMAARALLDAIERRYGG